MKLPISLVIITLNEESNIKRCIESVPWCDDIVVLDSQSIDKTKEIAKDLGARVFEQEFLGFRDQKQKATDLAKNDWVLSLDADECLSPELSQEIYELALKALPKNRDSKNESDSKLSSAHELESRIKSQIGSSKALENIDQNSKTTKESENLISFRFKVDAFVMPRLSYHMGRWIRHGGWYPDRQLRLFNKKKVKWSGGNVHEKIESKDKVYLKNNIHHFVFRDLTHQVDTNNYYSSLGAKDLFERGKKFSVTKLLLKPCSKFIETYILKRGFLDGLPGFIISVGASYSVFLKFSKLWGLERAQKKSSEVQKLY